jgi:hypothetical protein
MITFTFKIVSVKDTGKENFLCILAKNKIVIFTQDKFYKCKLTLLNL